MHIIDPLFNDEFIRNKIKRKLPYLFQIGNMECSRNGRVGQEVGTVREKILIALLFYKFEDKNVKNIFNPTHPDADVMLEDVPVSIKTITSTCKDNKISGIKVVWTVDSASVKKFTESFEPSADLLLTIIKWNNIGGLYYIRREDQLSTFKLIGSENFLKLLKEGTNNRGVEYSKDAVNLMINSAYATIPIMWEQKKLDYNVYDRWIDYWKLD